MIVIPVITCALGNYSIVEIGQNTEKSTGDWRRLAVMKTSMRKQSANTGVKNSQKIR